MQPYTINGAKVIFLNERAQSRSCKGNANACCSCDRILQDPFHFCSLSCKVRFLSHFYVSLSLTLYIYPFSFRHKQITGQHPTFASNNSVILLSLARSNVQCIDDTHTMIKSKIIFFIIGKMSLLCMCLENEEFNFFF